MKYTTIKEHHLYDKTFRKGARWSGRYVSVFVLRDYAAKRLMKANPEKKYYNRFGVSVSKKVELIDEVYHEVAVYRVVPRVTTHRGIHHAAHVALLAEDIVELYADGSSVLSEETLRYLRIPDELVGVEFWITETSTAVHSYIR